MNRYLREVIEFDRRHRMRVRAMSVAAAACVIAAALWSAGIPNAGWFAWLRGEETKAPAPPAQPIVSSPDGPATSSTPSVQRLHLVSTSPGRNAREGTAQLGTDRASPQTYAAGALLENGAALTEIYADHVLIERDGQTTELYVDGMAASSRRAAKPVVASLVAVAEPAADAVPRGASPPTYTEIIRAAPRFENDVIVGYDIYPGAQSGDFARLGLHAGDLLVAIDGAPVTSTEALNAALKQLAGGASMVATITRAGQEVSIALDGSLTMRSATALASAAPPVQ